MRKSFTSGDLISIEQLYRDGGNDADAARLLGISARTLYLWKAKYPDLLEAITRGKRPVDAEVETLLLDLCRGGWLKKITTVVDKDGKLKETRVTKQQTAPNFEAIRLWIMNRMRQKWGNSDKQPSEVDFNELYNEYMDALTGRNNLPATERTQ